MILSPLSILPWTTSIIHYSLHIIHYPLSNSQYQSMWAQGAYLVIKITMFIQKYMLDPQYNSQYWSQTVLSSFAATHPWWPCPDLFLRLIRHPHHSTKPFNSTYKRSLLKYGSSFLYNKVSFVVRLLNSCILLKLQSF